jgi:hypothetical protein
LESPGKIQQDFISRKANDKTPDRKPNRAANIDAPAATHICQAAKYKYCGGNRK